MTMAKQAACLTSSGSDVWSKNEWYNSDISVSTPA